MKIKKIVVGPIATNCYIIADKKNALIVDPGGDYSVIKEELQGFNLKGILITHYHFDHVGALEDLKEEYGVSVIDFHNQEIVEPFNYEIIPFPGHKEDLVAFYFKDSNDMFVGDFIFKGSIGRCNFEGGDISKMKESLKKLTKFPKTTKLHPGHGEDTTLKEELKNNIYFTL